MRLRELRAVTGISRAELERRAGLTANRLKIYEDGNRSQNVMYNGDARVSGFS